MPDVAIQWQRFEELSVEELYELLRFRQRIFVVEQRSPYPDLDGLDQSAWHLTARIDRELVGCLRLTPWSGPLAMMKIGRVAIAAELRRRSVGRMMMNEALGFCRGRCPGQPISLSAQIRLVPFYESFGFVTASDTYRDFGVEHVEMTLTPAG